MNKLIETLKQFADVEIGDPDGTYVMLLKADKKGLTEIIYPVSDGEKAVLETYIKKSDDLIEEKSYINFRNASFVIELRSKCNKPNIIYHVKEDFNEDILEETGKIIDAASEAFYEALLSGLPD